MPTIDNRSGLGDHDALAHHLATELFCRGDIVAEGVSFGAWSDGGIADVAAIRPSWQDPRPRIYEVKVSRSDFLSDVRMGKFKKYRRYCSQLFFATPVKLVDKREIPEGCGLTCLYPSGWRVAKAARWSTLDSEGLSGLMLAMLKRRHNEEFQRVIERRYALRTLQPYMNGRHQDLAGGVIKLCREVRRHREAAS